MKIEVDESDPRHLPIGIDSSPPIDPAIVAVFGAAVESQRMSAGGDMKVTMIVPFDQVLNVMPVMQFVGGVCFEITVRRVPKDQLPEPGW
jgi:hypothetical protein